jgi:hypothetical protein
MLLLAAGQLINDTNQSIQQRSILNLFFIAELRMGEEGIEVMRALLRTQPQCLFSCIRLAFQVLLRSFDYIISIY